MVVGGPRAQPRQALATGHVDARRRAGVGRVVPVLAAAAATVLLGGIGALSLGRATPSGPAASPPLVNVRDHGARGDGRSDDTAAFATAVAAAARIGTNVFVPVGDYRVAQVVLPSHVLLVGQRRETTVIRSRAMPRMLLDEAETLVLSSRTTGAGISNLTLQGHGTPGGAGDEIVLGFENAANVVVRGVTVRQAQGRGIFVTGSGSVRGVYRDIRIEDVYRAGERYGVGFWFYRGPSRSVIEGVSVDTTDASGISLDAGSSAGSGSAVADNRLTSITVVRAARQPHTAGMSWQGAQRNVLDGFRILDLAAQEAVALTVQQDQTTIESTGNVFSHGVLSDIGRSAIDLQSASGNTFSDIAVTNVGRLTHGNLIELGATTVQGGGYGTASADNTFARISLTQNNGEYRWGVVLNSHHVPIVRNHFVSIAWGRPSDAVVHVEGDAAPLSGRDGNTGLPP